MSDTTLLLLAGATALNGILAGASLDQSIKHLPARHRIGPVTYSLYSRASDLGNGILWYAGIGIGAALLAIAVAVVAYIQGTSIAQAPLIYSEPAYPCSIRSSPHAQLQPISVSATMRMMNRDSQQCSTALLGFKHFELWCSL